MRRFSGRNSSLRDCHPKTQAEFYRPPPVTTPGSLFEYRPFGGRFQGRPFRRSRGPSGCLFIRARTKRRPAMENARSETASPETARDSGPLSGKSADRCPRRALSGASGRGINGVSPRTRGPRASTFPASSPAAPRSTSASPSRPGRHRQSRSAAARLVFSPCFLRALAAAAML